MIKLKIVLILIKLVCILLFFNSIIEVFIIVVIKVTELPQTIV